MTDIPDPLLTLVVPAVPAVIPGVRHRIRNHLLLLGLERSGAVELAVGEAVGNAVLHAYPATELGRVVVVISVDKNRVAAVIRDEGVGPLPDPQQQGGRYGVMLMAALADRFELDGALGLGTTVQMEFLFSPWCDAKCATLNDAAAQ